jgi:hypothetical protein
MLAMQGGALLIVAACSCKAVHVTQVALLAWSQVNFPEPRHALISTTIGSFVGATQELRRKWWVPAAAVWKVASRDKGPWGAATLTCMCNVHAL